MTKTHLVTPAVSGSLSDYTDWSGAVVVNTCHTKATNPKTAGKILLDCYLTSNRSTDSHLNVFLFLQEQIVVSLQAAD